MPDNADSTQEPIKNTDAKVTLKAYIPADYAKKIQDEGITTMQAFACVVLNEIRKWVVARPQESIQTDQDWVFEFDLSTDSIEPMPKSRRMDLLIGEE